MGKVVTNKQKTEEGTEAEKEDVSLTIKNYEEAIKQDLLTEKHITAL